MISLQQIKKCIHAFNTINQINKLNENKINFLAQRNLLPARLSLLLKPHSRA